MKYKGDDTLNVFEEYKKIIHNPEFNPNGELGLFNNRDIITKAFENAGLSHEAKFDNVEIVKGMAHDYETQLREDIRKTIVSEFRDEFKKAIEDPKYKGWTAGDVGAGIMMDLFKKHEISQDKNPVIYMEALHQMNKAIIPQQNKEAKEFRKAQMGPLKSAGHKALKTLRTAIKYSGLGDGGRPRFVNNSAQEPSNKNDGHEPPKKQ